MPESPIDWTIDLDAQDDDTTLATHHGACPASSDDGIAPVRDWTRRRPPRPPLLVHWIDERGSVVRLISTSSYHDE